MSFLKKMFGKKDPVAEIRLCHSRQDWAGVLISAKGLDDAQLENEVAAEMQSCIDEAGDALAAINIEEGLWAHKSGNLLRAREDFQLALEQARSDELRSRAQQALSALDKGVAPVAEHTTTVNASAHADCNSCSPVAEPKEDAGMDLDEETRVELLLATMPPELAERYMTAGVEFRKAWLAAQEGDEKHALELLAAVPEAERNALFLFERGSLMARSGQHKKARHDLQAALTTEPGLFTAFDALIEVLVAERRIDQLEKTLKASIAEERFAGYCWGRLAELHAQRGALEPALAAGLKALEEGVVDPGLFALCAQLLERAERFDEAEALLMRLPAGGCGGGIHPMLAEYWLRRGKNIDKALESFKGAMRQEKDNPRWLLRIAQAYLAKGWRKEAAGQVERLMQQSELPEQLREELKATADQLQQK